MSVRSYHPHLLSSWFCEDVLDGGEDCRQIAACTANHHDEHHKQDHHGEDDTGRLFVLAGYSERCYAASRRVAVRTSDALLILRLEYFRHNQ